MAQQFGTGAAHVFLKIPQTQIKYFGTCESMPQDQRQPQYEMVMNDLTGSKVPLDLAWEGESSQISLVMTRWNEELALMLEDKPHSNNSTAGAWDWADVGTMMGLEDLAWGLYIVYTFGAAIANRAAYVAQGLRAGRHYPQCVVWAPETEETGTKPMKRHFLFYAWPKLNVTTRKLVLYDFDVTGCTSSMIT